jgi:hypothetical protein
VTSIGENERLKPNLSTDSRFGGGYAECPKHLVDALYEDANFVWLKDGKIAQQGIQLPRLPLLMDLGALDSFDKINAGHIDYVILSEDTKTSLLKNLLSSADFKEDKFLIFSYKTSSALSSAFLLVNFIKEIASKTIIIIHRDRDFMTSDEVIHVEQTIRSQGAVPFITKGVDIESYFCNPNHVANCLAIDSQQVKNWIDELVIVDAMNIQHEFTRKRDEIKMLFYRKGQLEMDPPETIKLFAGIANPQDKAIGKGLLRKLNGSMHKKFNKTVSLDTISSQLDVTDLKSILASSRIGDG